MKIKVKVDSKKLTAAFLKAPKVMAKTLRVAMKTNLQEIANNARTHHRFKARTGFLEKAITVDVAEDGLSGTIYLDSGLTPTRWKGQLVSYGLFVHEGHGTWRPDRFLFSAFRKGKSKLIKSLQRALRIAFKKVGLK